MSGNLSFSDITKNFGTTVALDSFSVQVNEGELVTLLGPSGCGKSTALRVAAGFEIPDGGDVKLGANSVLGLPASKREMGIVFQNYSLFPHLTVLENLEFGMRVRRASKAKRSARVTELLDLVRLVGLAERYPHQLSGGQQQRVALARALAVEPQVLLLDEPLSALDATVRIEVREEIRRIQRDSGIATLFVTHDQEEAMAISDQVCVMNSGKVEQVGAPKTIYRFPSTPFVARFVGRVNDLEVEILKPGVARLGGHSQEFKVPATSGIQGVARVLLRPEDVRLASRDDLSKMKGMVKTLHFGGATTAIEISVLGTNHVVRMSDSTRAINCEVGDNIEFVFDTERCLVTAATR
jgi:putative spermidine/putrescine transport system ATP-binding protein